MKNVKIKAIAIALAILMFSAVVLVACGNNPTPEAFDAEAAIADFESSVNTTVKLTYVTNYKVDVVRPGVEGSGGMDSFKRDVEATVVVEMDLGDDLYIKVTKSRQDKLIEDEATVSEQILYKKDGAYYYQTSSSAAVTVDDPAAKLATIFEEATYEQIGGLTLDALLYNNLDKAYELKLIGLSDTFIEEELVDPTYAAADNGGLKVTYKPEYVGYRTDGGWSDFKNEADGYAATVEIITNNKGYVTSMTENYNDASLVFNIMSNPPTVTITGTRSFTATYGEAINKAESVDFAPSTAVLAEAFGGSYVVMTCAMGDFGNLVPVANGGALELGKLICVRPTANEGYEIDKVIVNGSENPITNPANAGGFYCFNVAPGANSIEVTFKQATPTNGVVSVTNNTEYAYQLQSFLYGANGPSDYQVITDNIIVPGNSVFGAIVISGDTPVDVYVNGEKTTVNIPAGPSTFYCFSVKTGGAYEVVISEPGASEPAGDFGVVTVTNNTEYAYQLQSFEYVNGSPANYQEITDGNIVPGNSVFGAIVISADTPVTVIVNGDATTINIPSNGVVYYCFAVRAAGDFEVVINPVAE